MDLNKLYKEIEEAEVSLNAKRLKYIKEALAENNGIIKLKFKEFKEFKETNDAFDFDDQFPVIIEINGIPKEHQRITNNTDSGQRLIVTDATGDRWGKVRRAPVQGRRGLHHMA